jgi:hypothetical protein
MSVDGKKYIPGVTYPLGHVIKQHSNIIITIIIIIDVVHCLL